MITKWKAVFLAVLAAIAGMSYPASAQEGPDAIRKLLFMKGSWQCILHGGPSNGYKDTLTYSFSPDASWMLEQESGSVSGQPIWSAQMWGYDAARKKLVAYQFNTRSVFTKSVGGWENGLFVSRRDDNHATVSIRPRGKRAFDWIIAAPDNSLTVIQACRR